jgi:hypothetical protein
MEKLNEGLNNGIVPPELDVSNGFGSGTTLDWNKVLSIVFTVPMSSMRNVMLKRLQVFLDLTKWFAT